LNALTATFRAEVQATHPAIQYTLVSPGIVRTEFGLNSRHGGVDSRTLPNSQSAEEVAEVIAKVMITRQADVYTRVGARQMVLEYLGALAADPT
jgi:short-subunit dehydrogenase